MKTALAILFALSLGMSAAGDDEKAKKEFEILKASAEKGDARTQLLLGGMYYGGKGVEKDFKEAMKWYQKAAEQGYVNAQWSLGKDPLSFQV